MTHTIKHNFIFFSALFSLIFSIGTIKANVNKYVAAKLFVKYKHSVEEECTTAECHNAEKCLDLIIRKINHNYDAQKTNSLSNLEQDKITLKKIKNNASYWLWPNHPDDDAIRKQAEKSLKNIQQRQDFLQFHIQYIQAQKIIQLYSTMPVKQDYFKIWISQNFFTSHENPIIRCRENIQATISTIDQFSIENQMQYPQLYDQLTSIKKNIQIIFPTLDDLYQAAHEQQKLEKSAREYKELQQRQIDTQHRACKAQELHIQTEREKIDKIQELSCALRVLQVQARSEQTATNIKGIQYLINSLQQVLQNQNLQEQQLSRDLSRLQKMIDLSLEYLKVCEKHSDLVITIENNKRKIQTLQAQQATLQNRVEHTRVSSQIECDKLKEQLAQRERELNEQNQILYNLHAEIPVAQPCSNDNSYVEAQAHYAPEPSSDQRPPAYNPNYREKQ